MDAKVSNDCAGLVARDADCDAVGGRDGSNRYDKSTKSESCGVGLRQIEREHKHCSSHRNQRCGKRTAFRRCGCRSHVRIKDDGEDRSQREERNPGGVVNASLGNFDQHRR